jgi:hypothetical protein
VTITQDFTTLVKFKSDNSREGFEIALGRVRGEMVKAGCTGVFFAIETGGHYWRHPDPAYFLDEKDIPFRFANLTVAGELDIHPHAKLLAVIYGRGHLGKRDKPVLWCWYQIAREATSLI